MRRVPFFLFFFFATVMHQSLYCANEQEQVEDTTPLISLNYVDKDIISIVHELAALKKVNIISPQNEPKLSTKITFKHEGRVTLNEGWNYIEIILNKLGFSFVPQANAYTIVANQRVNQEALPLYVMSLRALPDSEDNIRFLYFFKNISLTSDTAQSNLRTILGDLLSPDMQNSYILDGATNSLLLSSKASTIKGIMHIINELDETGFRESLAVIELQKSNAAAVATILNQLIPGRDDAGLRFGPVPTQKPKFGYYFSENTKIISIDRLNAVVVLGSTEAIEHVRDFIVKYLDKDLGTGSSTVHVKSLQYLKASDTATMLQNLVKAQLGTAQSAAQQELRDTLSRAIIVAEKEERAQAMTPAQQPTDVGSQDQTQQSGLSSQGALIGGNNLIVAAQHEDWIILDELIDQLDIPQLQVALEVLVVDVTITDEQKIGAQTRNFAIKANEFNWQAANLVFPWLNTIPPGSAVPGVNSTSVVNMSRGLAADLLEMLKDANGNLFNIATLATAGNTVISFNNGNGIFSVLELLDSYRNATILSQPFVVTKNHQQATISIADTRLVRGSVQQQSTGGPIVLPRDTITADLSVTLKPRISKANTINLEITVQANDFVAPADFANNTITNRAIVTNAHIGNGEVLVLGGLTKAKIDNSIFGTPLIESIPLVGYFFKQRKRIEEKNTLMVFIAPTIIQPRLGGGVDKYTHDKLCYIKEQERAAEKAIDGVNFENLKDPITRVYFPSIATAVNREISYYERTGSYGMPLNEIKKEIDAEPINDCCKENAQKLKELVKDTCNPLHK